MKTRKSLHAYGPAWVGSGTCGLAKEGYWYHEFLPKDLFEGSTFVAKTVTADRNEGNMLLVPYYHTPIERFPKCIYIDLIRGLAINSVGLANPGVQEFLLRKRWQRIREPFFLSFMTLKNVEEEYVEETEFFTRVMEQNLPYFDSRKVALQLNVSCPNVGADTSNVVKKALTQLSILAKLAMPIVVKLNLLVAPEEAATIAEHPACDGICIANTLPFGTKFSKEYWEKLFPKGSPLLARNEKFGGGGLSGEPLFPGVVAWLQRFRVIDPHTYVNAGGGVMRPRDVERLIEEGADSISFATVAMVRPWRVPSIISTAHALTEH